MVQLAGPAGRRCGLEESVLAFPSLRSKRGRSQRRQQLHALMGTMDFKTDPSAVTINLLLIVRPEETARKEKGQSEGQTGGSRSAGNVPPAAGAREGRAAGAADGEAMQQLRSRVGAFPPTSLSLSSFASQRCCKTPQTSSLSFAETQRASAGCPGAGEPSLAQRCVLHVAGRLARVQATQGAGGGDTRVGTNPRTMSAPRSALPRPRGASTRLSQLRKRSRARARQFRPRPEPTTTEHRGKTVLFEACLGFVSKDDCPEPFIATVWDSLPGPAPILQGIFQKATAVLCNCKGTLPAEMKGEKGIFLL